MEGVEGQRDGNAQGGGAFEEAFGVGGPEEELAVAGANRFEEAVAVEETAVEDGDAGFLLGNELVVEKGEVHTGAGMGCDWG
jgi:hypothetical protein